MGQGQDKIARNLLDLQPTAIVELFLLYFNTVDKEDAFIAFHGGAIFNEGITWQGITYLPIPVETDGFEMHADGRMTRPKIKVSNKDYFVTDLLRENRDLQFAKIIRKRTFVKYLDDINFDGGNPWGEADSTAEISNDTYLISQKTAENKVFVEFELTSPLDLDNFEVNNRLIMSRYCSWYYRGNGCNYQGPPLETENGEKIKMNSQSIIDWSLLQTQNEWQTGKAYLSGDPVFVVNKKIKINPDPANLIPSGFAKIWYVCQTGHISTYETIPDLNQKFWKKDGCNKKIDGCRKRFPNSDFQAIDQETFIAEEYPIDFAYKLPSEMVNSIGHLAKITANDRQDDALGPASSTVDYRTGQRQAAGYWWDLGTYQRHEWTMNISSSSQDPIISYEWSGMQKINKIILYNQTDTRFSFPSGKILFYDSTNNLIYQQPFNTFNDSSILNFPTQTAKKITISGDRTKVSLTSSETKAGFREVQIFTPSINGLYSDEVSNILTGKDWHIGMWLAFHTGEREFNTSWYNYQHLLYTQGNNYFTTYGTFLPKQQVSLMHNLKRSDTSVPHSGSGINLFMETPPIKYVDQVTLGYLQPKFSLCFGVVSRVGDTSNTTLQTTTSSVRLANSIKYSEDFSQSSWTKQSSTISTQKVFCLNGKLQGSILQAAATSSTTTHGISQTTASLAAASYTFSIFAKPNSLKKLQLSFASKSAIFDISSINGSTSNVSAGATASIEKYGSWYLCSLTASSTSASPITININLVTDSNQSSFAAIGSENLYLWGAHFRLTSNATKYLGDNYFKNYLSEQKIYVGTVQTAVQSIQIVCFGGVPDYNTTSVYSGGEISLTSQYKNYDPNSNIATDSYWPLYNSDSTWMEGSTEFNSSHPVGAYIGEWFAFKDTNYTSKTGSTFFGVNNWQYNTLYNTPVGDFDVKAAETKNFVSADYTVTSPLSIYRIAVWTGFSAFKDVEVGYGDLSYDSAEARLNFFDRAESIADYYNPALVALRPPLYHEVTGHPTRKMTGDLFAWWEMDLSDTAPYRIQAKNNAARYLNLSGDFDEKLNRYETFEITQLGQTISQSPKTFLPFGGFPGTDRYGQ